MENIETLREFDDTMYSFEETSDDCIQYLLPGAGPCLEECQPDYTAQHSIYNIIIIFNKQIQIAND
jgi:hypothetical protein